MLGLGVCDGLDQGGQLLVEPGDLLEHGGVLRVLDEGQELGAERVVDGHAHVVDCGLWGFVEVLVDTDRVGQLDRWERPQVRGEVLVEVGDVARFAGDYLGTGVLVLRRRLGKGTVKEEETYLSQEIVAAEVALLFVLLKVPQLDVLPDRHYGLLAGRITHVDNLG